MSPPLPPRLVRDLSALALAACALLQDGGGVVSLARLAPGPPPAPPAGPINVLFVLSDQHTARALGTSTNGFGGLGDSLTPELDTLASQGMRFERAFCSSGQCCPSRFTLLTGLEPHESGLRWNEVWEPRDELTFAELARAHGYVTATFGKHHMFWLEQDPPLAEDHGFDLVVDRRNYDAWCAANGMPEYDAPGQIVAVPNVPGPLAKTGYTKSPNAFHPAGYWADRVIQFLEDRAGPQGDGRLFVAWYSMYGPHTPVLPSGPADPHDWAHLFQPSAGIALPPNLTKQATTTRLALLQATYAGVAADTWREILSYYYGYVTQIDFNVGRVLKRLDELGLADDTLVVYTSDHGEMGAEMRCWTKGGGSYDAVTRVPLIVRLPSVFPAGKASGELVAGIDLFPTLTELTGVYVPDGLRARLRGRSLLELAPGPPPADWRQVVFNEFGMPGLPTLQTRMARTKEEKYSFDELGGGEEELYELSVDPHEMVDLSDDPSPAVQAALAALRGQLNAWWGDPSTHAPVYLITGNATKKPPRAQDPVPGDGLIGVPRDVDPSWLPTTSADVQTVYLGTSPGALAPFESLVAMDDRFNPGTLAAGTTYFWRVDSTNPNGTTPGAVWSFTTAAGGPDGPGLATGPAPAQHAEDVAPTVPLAWTPPADALSQDLWFGPAEALAPAAAGLAPTVASWDPGPLEAGAEYAWRVDTGSAGGTTEGTVWTFATDPAGLPAPASLPHPRHLGADVAPGPVLRWLPGSGATSHEVWFGTGFPLAFAGGRTAASFAPGPLVPGQTYYWRVDEVNAAGRVRGLTWRFTVAD